LSHEIKISQQCGDCKLKFSSVAFSGGENIIETLSLNSVTRDVDILVRNMQSFTLFGKRFTIQVFPENTNIASISSRIDNSNCKSIGKGKFLCSLGCRIEPGEHEFKFAVNFGTALRGDVDEIKFEYKLDDQNIENTVQLDYTPNVKLSLLSKPDSFIPDKDLYYTENKKIEVNLGIENINQAFAFDGTSLEVRIPTEINIDGRVEKFLKFNENINGCTINKQEPSSSLKKFDGWDLEKPYIGGVILTCSKTVGDKVVFDLDFIVENAGLGKTGFVATSSDLKMSAKFTAEKTKSPSAYYDFPPQKSEILSEESELSIRFGKKANPNYTSIIIFSVLGGVLLILIVIAVLWKVGFFKVDNNQDEAEIENQPLNTFGKNPGDQIVLQNSERRLME